VSLLRRKRVEDGGPTSPLSELMVHHRDTMDSGQLVRALARSVVHVPMPGAPREAQPRVESTADSDGPPLYIVEDEDGRHAFVYSTARRLVQAAGEITAASVPFATLLMAWPEGVDLVIDPGHPEALEVPPELLRATALEVAGIPTGTSLQPSPEGADARLPDPEPVQVLGVSRELAEGIDEVLSLHRAELVNREPDARPVLYLAITMSPVSAERKDEIMSAFSAAISDVDPNPFGLLPVLHGTPSNYRHLVDAVTGLEEPYWKRGP
jgi:hypothetical protein